jgi:ribose 5-phosphate isomerase A
MMSDIAKKNAALKALELVEDGMILGLGTGSTAAHFVRGLGEKVAAGLRVQGAPTSEATRALALECGVPLIDPDTVDWFDLTVDGADEIDPQFNLIKGGGAALLREKIIAFSSRRFVVIADQAKMVATLGAFKLPVEVTPFAWGLTRKRLIDAIRGAGVPLTDAALRMGREQPLYTDGGNLILDCACGQIADPDALARAIGAVPGVVEHGLFVAMTRDVIIGDADGAKMVARGLLRNS